MKGGRLYTVIIPRFTKTRYLCGILITVFLLPQTTAVSGVVPVGGPTALLLLTASKSCIKDTKVHGRQTRVRPGSLIKGRKRPRSVGGGQRSITRCCYSPRPTLIYCQRDRLRARSEIVITKIRRTVTANRPPGVHNYNIPMGVSSSPFYTRPRQCGRGTRLRTEKRPRSCGMCNDGMSGEHLRRIDACEKDE